MDSRCLQNETLSVTFAHDRIPVVLEIHDRRSGLRVRGGDPDKAPVLNEIQESQWDEWERQSDGSGGFTLTHLPSGVVVDIHYTLGDRRLKASLSVGNPGDGSVRSVGWPGTWLIQADAAQGFTAYRERVHRKRSRRVKYFRTDELEELGRDLEDAGPVKATLACLFDERVGIWLDSDAPVMPLLTYRWPSGLGDGQCGGMAMGPFPHQLSCRGRIRAPLNVAVVFSGDLNGDDCFDVSDYLLAQNRRLPEPPGAYRNRFWYKISCLDLERGRVSDLAGCADIIRAISAVTDGFPQLPLLTGWKVRDFEERVSGMDIMGFGGMDGVETDIGTLEELQDLHVSMRQYNAEVSYHMNLDDTYREHADWDQSLVCRERDGSMVEWIRMHGRIGYHLSHTKDVESGKVFARLERILDKVPVREAIHLDAFRNTNYSWEEDGFIGPVDELEAGVYPILDFLKKRGLAPSLEGVRQMPTQPASCASAFWHMSRVIDFLPRLVLFHGKIIGGGLLDCPERVRYALGTSINADICRNRSPHPLSLSLESEWSRIVDLLYLGFFLYQYLLDFELRKAWEDETSYCLEYEDHLVVTAAKDGSAMRITHGPMLLAEGDDRFLPFKDGIRIYSLDGGEKAFRLPEWWRERKLTAYLLDAEGRRPFDAWSCDADVLTVTLPPRTPVRFLEEA